MSAPTDPRRVALDETPYADLAARLARIDGRDTRYRFHLEADLDWGALLGSGDLFGPALLGSLGVDAAALARDPEAWSLFQWAFGLATCRAFEVLERAILRFGAAEEARLGPSRSLDLLVEEEAKHIRLFERIGAQLAKVRPDWALRLAAHTDASAARVVKLIEEDAPAGAARAHWAFWFNTLLFEEYTLYLQERLEEEATGLRPAWVRAHDLHRREEAQHVVTDAAHLEASSLPPEERLALSKLCHLGIAARIRDFIGLTPACALLAEARPELAEAVRPRPLEETGLWRDILTHRAFRRTRAASPYIQELAEDLARGATAKGAAHAGPPAPATAAKEADPRVPEALALVAAALEREPEAIAPDASFAALGLDSLKAADLHGRMQKRLGRKVDLLALLACKTPRALAVLLDGPSARAPDPVRVLDGANDPPRAKDAELAKVAREGRKNGVDDIAVVAMAGRFPAAPDLDAFWSLIREGRSAIRDVPPERWSRERFHDPSGARPGTTTCARGGFLEEVAAFDAEAFGLSWPDAQETDPQHRLFLEVCAEALSCAGFPEGRTGVFATAGGNQYNLPSEDDWERVSSLTAQGSLPHMVAARVAQVFRLSGPALAIDAACASALVAVHMACESLRRGECEQALAGGVELLLDVGPYVMFGQAGVLSRDGAPRPFDRRASGLVPGEGAGVVVLRPLARALADGDPIIGVIKGGAVNNDGGALSLLAPNPEGQRAVLREAYRRAGVDPATVTLVEAHAAGTPVGDPIEVRALSTVFLERGARRGACVIGSVKSNVGHLFHAAGIAGLIKVLLALRHREQPPTASLEEPDERIGFDETPFTPLRAARPWAPSPGTPRRAGISAFGIGGTNGHLVLEEGPPRDAEGDARPAGSQSAGAVLLAVAAHSTDSLLREGRALAGTLEALPEEMLPAFAAATCARARRFGEGPFRAWLVVEGKAEALRALAEVRPSEAIGPRPRVALVFGAPGTQAPGMARILHESEPAFRRALERACALLEAAGSAPLLPLLTGADPGGLLERIEVTQPAVFAMGFALAEWLASLGIEAEAFVGHSGGEVTAAVRAGALTLEEAARLVVARGRGMAACKGGLMAAVFAPESRVRPRLAAHGPDVAIAAVNEPAQCVVSGPRDAVEALLEDLLQDGIAAKPLSIGCAAHSPLMRDALPALEEATRALRLRGRAAAPPLRVSGRRDATDPSPPPTIYSTATGARADGPLDAAHWRAHLLGPVRFAEAIRAAREDGIDCFVEVSSTAALSPCMEAILDAEVVSAGRDPGAPRPLVLPLLRRSLEGRRPALEALATLAARGIPVALDRLGGHAPRTRPALPPFPYARRRCWIARPEVLSLESEPTARDHVARGRPIAPAARLIEIALEATALERRPGGGLDDVIVPEALPLLPGEPRRVRARVTGPASERRVVVESAPEEGGRRVRHLEATVRADPDDAPHACDLVAIRLRCREAIEPAALYAHTAENGLAHGPHMRRVTRLLRGEREVLAWLEPAPGAPARPFDPALVDGAMQALGGLTVGQPSPDGPATYLGFAYGRVRIHGPLSGPCLVHARRSDEWRPGAESLRCDVVIADPAGRPLVELRDVGLKRSRSAWAGAGDRGVSRSPTDQSVGHARATGAAAAAARPMRVHEVAWEPAPLAEATATTSSGVAMRAFAPRVVGGPEHPFPEDDPALDRLFAGLGAGAHLLLLEPAADEMRRLAGALERAAAPLAALTVVTSDAAVAALARVVGLERAGLSARAVQVARGTQGLALAEVVLAEVALGAAEAPPLVRHADGRREAPVLRALAKRAPGAAPSGATAIERGRPVWITGGGGAIGVALAIALHRRHDTPLLLTGRSGALRDDARRRLEEAGVRFLYAKAAASRADECARALSLAEARWGRAQGVLHAAGVIEDRPLAEARAADLEEALAAKVEGGRIALDLARRHGFAFAVLFSSIVARWGGLGQGVYAAANAGLSGLAWEGRAAAEASAPASSGEDRGPRIVAIDWGPWHVGMASAPAFQARYAALGLRPLTAEEGLDALERALASDAAEVLALAHEPGVETKLATVLRASAGSPAPAPAAPAPFPVPALAPAPAPSPRPPPPPTQPLPRFVQEFLASRLRRRPEEVDPRAAFSRMGVDSLMAVELVKALEKRLSRRLYPTLLFEVPTIEALARFLEKDGGR